MGLYLDNIALVYQTKFGAKEGNCLNACLASLFSLPIGKTPDFSKMKGTWISGFLRFLKSLGYQYVGTGTPEEVSEECGYTIVCGTSPRGLLHSVIYKDGKPFHDPHPDGGFVKVEYFYMIEKEPGADKEKP